MTRWNISLYALAAMGCGVVDALLLLLVIMLYFRIRRIYD